MPISNEDTNGNPIRTLYGSVATSDQATLSSSITPEPTDIDFSREYHYTIDIPDFNSNLVTKTWGGVNKYLPIETVSYSLVNMSTTSFPLGIFGDISFISGKKLNSIELTIVDTQEDTYEKLLTAWERKSIIDNNRVGYLSEIVKILNYKSYKYDGTVNISKSYEVMLAGSIRISRSYASNNFKKITFKVIIVGEIN